jgi:exopolyphosphatase/pppGpp-phosphohydrolase
MSAPRVPTIKTMRKTVPTRTTGMPNDPDLSHPKLAAADQWAAKRLGGSAHERRVASIAATLFDLTAPLHGLTSTADRRLLQVAALAHDVGRSAGKEGHPVSGAAMVLSDESLPLAAAERRAVAYLTLHHRGAVPAEGSDDVLHHGEDDAGRLLKLLALLRAADALDNRTLESPQLVFALLPGPARAGAAAAARPRLRVTCYLQADSAKARRVYERRKKFRLLEDVLGCRVEVEIVQARALRMVA